MKTSTRRHGFSLVEVLVAITIAAILLALLAPAVLSARAAARKMDCSQRLRQIGIAFHNYHSRHNFLPYIQTEGSRLSSAWRAILPDMGLQSFDLYIAELEALPNDGPGMELLYLQQTRVVSEFQCPSDSTSCPVGANFAMNFGGSGSSTFTAGSLAGVGWPDGVFAGRTEAPPASFSSITDGLSNTAMASEFLRLRKLVPPYTNPTLDFDRTEPKSLLFNLIPGARTNEEVAEYSSRCRGLDPNSAPVYSVARGLYWLEDQSHYTYTHFDTPNQFSCIGNGGLDTGALSLTVGSGHPGGVNVLFADGSTRFTSNSVDLRVWRAMGTRSGAEVVSGE